MDKEAFYAACEKIIGTQRSKKGIGTLGEKTLHAVLKNYYEPFEQNHEILYQYIDFLPISLKQFVLFLHETTNLLNQEIVFLRYKTH